MRTSLYCITLVLLLGGGTVVADESDISQTELLDDLVDLTERVREESAADRWVVFELDALISRYEALRVRSLLVDDFSDGDYTANPSWELASGEFWVDSRAVLRSTVSAAEDSPDTTQQDQSIEDAFLALLVNELSDEQGSDEETQAASRGPAARLRIPIDGSSVFDLELELIPYQEASVEGRFFVDLYAQGGGLRLVVLAGGDPRVALIALGEEGNEMLARDSLAQPLNRYRPVAFSMSRDAVGNVSVAVNETTTLRVAGPELGDLRRLVVSNMQGDWGLERIALNSDP